MVAKRLQDPDRWVGIQDRASLPVVGVWRAVKDDSVDCVAPFLNVPYPGGHSLSCGFTTTLIRFC